MRQPILESTPQTGQESFHYEVVEGRGYGAQWHFHPEIQLTVVLKSRGHRVVGDNLSPLSAGDMVLIGANLPHVWHQDEAGSRSNKSVHAIVLRFLDSFLGHDFLHKPEMDGVRRLLARAGRGLHVTGKTRDEVERRMVDLGAARGLNRLIGLLGILNVLAESGELKPLSSPRFTPELSGTDQNRMQRVLEYIHSNLNGLIERDEAARRASLSAGAFSRFFKTRTGKTLPQYVNELRIGQACSRLAEMDDKITDIALDSGFTNLANFNRQFQKVTGLAPRAYRMRFQQSSGIH